VFYSANVTNTEVRVRRGCKYFYGLFFILFAFIFLPKLAHADEQITEIKIPAYGTVELPVSGHCMEYGKLFPGEILIPVELASHEVQSAIGYSGYGL